MKNKRQIFKKAMADIEEEGYSCNCLGLAIAPHSENPERVAVVEKYRAMFGFDGEKGYNGGEDHFLVAVTDRKEKDIFGLRILLLGFACEAWGDVGL